MKVEGSKTSGTGATENSNETDRGEVMTPTHRFGFNNSVSGSYVVHICSAIDLAENPLDRRALVSLKKQLEIDQPNTALLSVSI